MFVIVKTREKHMLRPRNFSAVPRMGSKKECCFISFPNTSLHVLMTQTLRPSGVMQEAKNTMFVISLLTLFPAGTCMQVAGGKHTHVRLFITSYLR